MNETSETPEPPGWLKQLAENFRRPADVIGQLVTGINWFLSRSDAPGSVDIASQLESPDLTALLPNEVLIDEIFYRLDMKSRMKARRTCRRWRSAVPLADRRGRLFVGQLPFKMDPNQWGIDANQVFLALQSTLHDEGRPKVKTVQLKGLSIVSPPGVRLWHINKAALQLIVVSCPNLISLRLEDLEWSTSDVSEFDWTRSRLNKLNDLSLDAPISDAQLMGICQSSPKISALKLSGSNLTDFRPISTLSDLQDLDLQAKKISNDQFKLICTACPKLTRLGLLHCRSLTDFKCLKSLQNLRSLTVGRRFDDTQVNLMPDNWCLQEFRGCGGLTDSGLTTLSQKCASLRILELSKCASITDESVWELVDNCLLLESVELLGTRVTDASLPLLERFLPSASLGSN